MSAQHTPGPWAVTDQGEANTMALLDADGNWLAKILWNGTKTVEEQRANMRLIAAAPKLLAATKALIESQSAFIAAAKGTVHQRRAIRAISAIKAATGGEDGGGTKP